MIQDEPRDLSLEEIKRIADAAKAAIERREKEDEIVEWLNTHRKSITRILDRLLSLGAITCNWGKLENFLKNKNYEASNDGTSR